jgi:uncharacterized protein YijF (DUF1287 family)
MKAYFSLLFFLLNFTLLAQKTTSPSLAQACADLTEDQVIYDPSYFSIAYPMGDVPADRGVCTDVVVRAYRKCGIDLQQKVHEDMKANFAIYPQRWGLRGPDKNIDHRRVPNLMTFFGRFGEVHPNSSNSTDYQPGDIVCWDLGGGMLHIGMVSDQRNSTNSRYLIVHNIGAGQVFEDVLFDYKVIGHYRYLG